MNVDDETRGFSKDQLKGNQLSLTFQLEHHFSPEDD